MISASTIQKDQVIRRKTQIFELQGWWGRGVWTKDKRSSHNILTIWLWQLSLETGFVIPIWIKKCMHKVFQQFFSLRVCNLWKVAHRLGSFVFRSLVLTVLHNVWRKFSLWFIMITINCITKSSLWNICYCWIIWKLTQTNVWIHAMEKWFRRSLLSLLEYPVFLWFLKSLIKYKSS